jgi:hypothetical protein
VPKEPESTDAPEVKHLEVEPYGDDERVEAPDWYEGDTQ